MAKRAVNEVLPTNDKYWLYLGIGIKRSNATLVFNTVADMKASTLL
jgi:hypothetical protein